MDNREQASVAAKHRMASFRLGQSTTSSDLSTLPKATISTSIPHARSHSHNNSISNLPLKLSSTNNVNPLFDEFQDLPSSPTPRSRPNSHHRRRSSVSTRRESAEMMGFAPPLETVPDTTGELADSRYLALRALEGHNRPDYPFMGGFTKVEIPEFGSLESDAPKPKPPFASFGITSSIAGKRDSFGKLLHSSSSIISDQLHTLLEEEEEEEDCMMPELVEGSPVTADVDEEKAFQNVNNPQPIAAEVLPVPSVAPQPYRHRPSNLVLRPLSLTPNSLPLSRVADSLLTPSLTPSPRMAGLKALTLGSSPSSSISSMSSISERRHSLSVNPSPRPVIPEQRSSFGGYVTPPQRRSSISYKRTDMPEHTSHLPTPQATPTAAISPLHAKLPSLPKSSADIDCLPDLDRPLSPTEQAFLFRSHTSLLCRISELENAITGGHRPRSRSHERLLSITSTSTMSESDSVSSQPSDELLQLVSDLKAERDELMRDIDGWRTRVRDLDKQIGVLNRRIEAERRECWVARERLGVLEVEKKRVREDLETERLENRRLREALSTEEAARMHAENDRDSFAQLFQEEQEKRHKAEQETQDLQAQLAQAHEHVKQVEADLHAATATPKTAVTMRHFMDSTSTNVEEYIPLGIQSLKLNSAREEPEDHDLPRSIKGDSECDDESDHDELAHYEDDDGLGDDMIFDDDHTSSSFGSAPHTNSHLLGLELSPVSPASSPVTPSHTRSGSIKRGWSFAQAQSLSPAVKQARQVDHFFECLDALDTDTEFDLDARSISTDDNMAKQFWQGAVMQIEDEDELPPFVLPSQPSPPKMEKKTWKEIEAAKLEIVTEENEEDEDVFNVPSTPTPKLTRMRRPFVELNVPAYKNTLILKAPPTPKRATSPSPEAVPSSVPASAPKDSYTVASSSSSSTASLTPPAKVASISGVAIPSMIPRLSTSPKTPQMPGLPIITPPTPSRIPTATKATPFKSRMVLSSRNGSTPSNKLVSSQPKAVVPRSSIPHVNAPRVTLTRVSLTSQTSVTAQSLTAKLSQLWAGRTNNNSPMRKYISKERQLDKLRTRLRSERPGLGVECARCREGVIRI